MYKIIIILVVSTAITLFQFSAVADEKSPLIIDGDNRAGSVLEGVVALHRSTPLPVLIPEDGRTFFIGQGVFPPRVDIDYLGNVLDLNEAHLINDRTGTISSLAQVPNPAIEALGDSEAAVVTITIDEQFGREKEFASDSLDMQFAVDSLVYSLDFESAKWSVKESSNLTHSFIVFIEAVYGWDILMASPDNVTDAAKNMLSSDPKQFIEIYGTHFVSAVAKAATARIEFTYTFNTRKDLDEFRTHVSGGSPEVSGSVSLSSLVNSEVTNGELSIRISAHGGPDLSVWKGVMSYDGDVIENGDSKLALAAVKKGISAWMDGVEGSANALPVAYRLSPMPIVGLNLHLPTSGDPGLRLVRALLEAYAEQDRLGQILKGNEDELPSLDFKNHFFYLGDTINSVWSQMQKEHDSLRSQIADMESDIKDLKTTLTKGEMPEPQASSNISHFELPIPRVKYYTPDSGFSMKGKMYYIDDSTGSEIPIAGQWVRYKYTNDKYVPDSSKDVETDANGEFMMVIGGGKAKLDSWKVGSWGIEVRLAKDQVSFNESPALVANSAVSHTHYKVPIKYNVQY